MKARPIYKELSLLLVILLGVYTAGIGWAREGVDFSRFAVVGDSLAAGVQNLSLREDFQPNSYAALVARQAGASFPLPLIALPGVPPPLVLYDPGPPPVLGLETGISTGRINPFLQPFNVSIPNMKIDEVLGYRPDCVPDPSIGGIRLIDVYTELILGLPACIFGGPYLSELETAEAMAPTFTILWVGNNDTLWAAVLGVTSEITDPAVFRTSYEEIVRRLVATGTKLVIGNLPNVTVLPSLTSAEEVSSMTGVDLAILGPLLGIGPGDYVTLFALDAIEAILAGLMPGPLPDNLVVTAAEVSAIQAAADEFNSVVYETAARYGTPVVDMRGVLNQIDAKGILVGGQRLTTDYLGGLFSLDGFHPTNTGHAITANEFIKIINRAYGADIPLVDVSVVKESDPLVFPSTGKPPSRSGNK